MQSVVVLAMLEQAINAYLKAHSNYQQSLEQLNGKTLGLEIKGLAFRFYFIFTKEKIFLQSTLNEQPDLMITAPPFSLLQLFTKKQAEAVLFSAEVEIKGDVILAQQIKKLFNEVDIDWDYYLSLIVGDIVANESKRFVDNNIERLKNFATNLSNNIVEYIQEEKNILPSKYRAEEFFKEVDALRSETDLLEMKIKRLEKKHGATGS